MKAIVRTATAQWSFLLLLVVTVLTSAIYIAYLIDEHLPPFMEALEVYSEWFPYIVALLVVLCILVRTSTVRLLSIVEKDGTKILRISRSKKIWEIGSAQAYHRIKGSMRSKRIELFVVVAGIDGQQLVLKHTIKAFLGVPAGFEATLPALRPEVKYFTRDVERIWKVLQ